VIGPDVVGFSEVGISLGETVVGFDVVGLIDDGNVVVGV